jgi:hypothetical protein
MKHSEPFDKNRQRVLIRTDRHSVDFEPDEQWIGRESAAALLLLQELRERKTPSSIETQLVNLLYRHCESYRWSKWDMRSLWYLKAVEAPVHVDPETDLIISGGCSNPECGCKEAINAIHNKVKTDL